MGNKRCEPLEGGGGCGGRGGGNALSGTQDGEERGRAAAAVDADRGGHKARGEPVHRDVVAPGVRHVERDGAADLGGGGEDRDVRDRAVAGGAHDVRHRCVVVRVGRQRLCVLLRTPIAAKGLLRHKNARPCNRLFVRVHSVTDCES